MAKQTTSAPMMKGIGVRMKGTSSVDTKPSKTRVKRSPRHDATAGAMLSGSRLYFRQRTTRVHINEPSSKPERHAAVIVEHATINKLFCM